jgi:lipoyl(octanoyl) transferase
MNLNIINLGKMEYEKALDIQEKLQRKRIDDEIDDTFLVVEHPPVITMGKRGKEESILVPQEVLDKENFKIVWVGRGGDATYHGPGQMVGYPIINLVQNKMGIRKFVENIQTTFIDMLQKEYSITASPASGVHTGVWVDEKKITAIGISVRRGVTMHGYAFNINTNIRHFDYINPCGLGFGKVTSLEKIMGKKMDFDSVCEKTIQSFCDVFHATPQFKDLEDIL